MDNLLTFERAHLRVLTIEEQIGLNGGAPIAPIVTVYAGLLAIAYYAGYGAHVVYDYFKD